MRNFKNNRGKRSVFIGAMLIGAVLSASLAWGEDKMVVRLDFPKRSTIVNSERATGELVAPKRANLQMKNKGTLEKLYFEEGDRVKKGDLLAALELENFNLAVDAAERQCESALAATKSAQTTLEVVQSGIRQAQVRVDAAEKEYERAKNLKAKDSLTQQQFDRSESEYKLSIAAMDMAKKQALQAQSGLELSRAQERVAKVGLQTAQQRLDDSKLYAPFDGLLVARPALEHEMPGDKTVIYGIIDDSRLELIARLPERFLSYVKPGTEINFRSALSSKEISAGVTTVLPNIDPQSRSFTFKSQIDNADGIFRNGSYVDVNVILEKSENALVLPAEAVKTISVPDGDKIGSVFTVSSDKVKEIKVKLGIQKSGMIEIREGIDEKTPVVISGIEGLSEGMSVQVSPVTSHGAAAKGD